MTVNKGAHKGTVVVAMSGGVDSSVAASVKTLGWLQTLLVMFIEIN